jgi:hypothetical protein
MKILLLILVFAFTSNVQSTSVPEKNLEEVLEMTDHVIRGLIIRVDMIDRDGNEITDLDSRTGRNGNKMRIHLEVYEVIKSNITTKPSMLIVEIWDAWHMTFKNIQHYPGNEAIFLLKGKEFSRAYSGHFI